MPAELTPALTRAEVYVTGNAYVRGDAGRVRLVVQRGAASLIEREILVRPDTTVARLEGTGRRAVALGYHNAVQAPQNPRGSARPQLFDPLHEAWAACVSPLPTDNPMRCYQPADVMQFEEPEPEFRWARLQSVPPAQQLSGWHGRERIRLWGTFPERESAEVEVPVACPTVQRYGRQATERDGMRLVRVHLDPEADAVHCIYQYDYQLYDDAELEHDVLAVAWDASALPTTARQLDLAPHGSVTATTGSVAASAVGTIDLSGLSGLWMPAEGDADSLPFRRPETAPASRLGEARGGVPDAPFSHERGRKVVAPSGHQVGTLPNEALEAAIAALRQSEPTPVIEKKEVPGMAAAEEAEARRRAEKAEAEAQAEERRRMDKEVFEREQREGRERAREARQREREARTSYRIRKRLYGNFGSS